MFRQFESAVKITALFLFLGLGGWSWFQSQKINSLKAENHAQAQMISQLQQRAGQLQQALEAERKAVIFQQEIAERWRKRVERSNEQIRAKLQQDACSVRPLPDGVGDELKRLHKQGSPTRTP